MKNVRQMINGVQLAMYMRTWALCVVVAVGCGSSFADITLPYSGEVPSVKHPLTISREVTPFHQIVIKGDLTLSGCHEQNRKALILGLKFTDKDGNVLPLPRLQHNERHGSWRYIAIDGERQSISVEATVPRSATHVEVIFSRFYNDLTIALSGFDVLQRKPLSLTLLECVVLHPFAGVGMFVLFLLAVAFSAWRWKISLWMVSVWGLMGLLSAGALLALCAVGTCGATWYVSGSEESFSVRVTFAMICLTAIAMSGWSLKRLMCTLPDWLISTLLVVICFCAHLLVLNVTENLFTQVMVSDFSGPQAALAARHLTFVHESRHFYWCNYELLMSLCGILFAPVLRTGQIVNAFCCAMTLVPVYFLTRKIDRRLPVFMALLVGFYPTNLMYSTVLASDYVAACFFSFALWGMVVSCEEERRRKCLPLVVAAAFAVGVAHAMRPLGLIFEASCFVGTVLWGFGGRRKNLVRLLLVCGVFVLSAFVFAKGVQRMFVEAAKPQQLEIRKLSVCRFLYVGLNVDTGAGYSDADARDLRECSNEEVGRRLKDRILRDWRGYPALLKSKYDILYESDAPIVGRYYSSIANGQNSKLRLPCWLGKVVDGYYLMICACVALGILGLCLAIIRDRVRLLPGLIAGLMILGFTLLMMLMEVQARYRVAIYPFYFLLIPYVGQYWRDKDKA